MALFCDQPYWQDNSTWYTSDPDFSDCFQKTVLVWIPCGYLWILFPVQVYITLYQKARSACSASRLFWMKLAIALLLCVTCCAELGHCAKNLVDYNNGVFSEYNYAKPVQYADLASILVHLFTYMLFIVYVWLDRRKGRRSSGILFIFWTLLTITESVTFRTNINRIVAGLSTTGETFEIAIQIVQYALILVQLVASSISADICDDQAYGLKKNSSPEKHSPFLSQLLFWWFNSLVYRGWKEKLEQADLWNLNPCEKATQVTKIFLKKLDQTPKSLGRALFLSFWTELLYSALLKLLYNVLLFSIPELLRLLMRFINDESHEHIWKGYLFAALILLASSVQTLSMGHYFHRCNILGLRIRTAVMSAVYRKVIRVSQFANGAEKLGQPLNLISVDTQRLMDVASFVNQLWEVPLQIGVAMYLLHKTLGAAAFTGLGIMVISIPIEGGVAFWSKKLQVSQMVSKDARIKLTQEVFRTIKLLKLYAWEEVYERKILKFRKDELRSLRTVAYLTAFSTFYSIISPVIVALTTFATYVLTDPKHNLDSEKAFVALAIFNILKSPMNMIPPTIGSVVQALVSKTRLSRALSSQEADSYLGRTQTTKNRTESEQPASAVTMTNGNFAWAKDEPVCLQDISISFPTGKLIGLVGQAGSGKTALCKALLGLMDIRSGSVSIGESIAYMPQQSWIQSRSVKDNILFGRPFSRTCYQTVVENCALSEDVDDLPFGDATELSDQGSNLSGGQKQRLCLARTVYGYADVFMLDDPLSALDAKVSKQVFEKILGSDGLLKNKTRIVVMNGYQFLPHFDLLVVLEGGKISEVGTFNELLSQTGIFSEFLQTHLRHEIEKLHTNELESGEATHRHKAFKEICAKLPHNMRASLRQHHKSVTAVNRPRRSSIVSRIGSLEELQERLKKRTRSTSGSETQESNGRSATGTPTTASQHSSETVALNKTNWATYGNFIRHITIPVFAVIILSNVISTAFFVSTGIWLSEWTEKNRNLTHANKSMDFAEQNKELYVYAILGCLQGVFLYISMISLAYGLIIASRVIHNTMLKRLLHAPMWFFDTTPLGRITNRFSKDVDAVDVNVAQSLRQCLNSAFNILGTLAVLIYAYPLFMAFMVPIAFVYVGLQYFYISTSRQLKQLESVARSPIFSHFQETLSGAGIINLFKQRNRFIVEFSDCLDTHNKLAYLNLAAQRWLSLRLELIGNIIVFLAAVMGVYGRDNWNTHAGVVGLSITYAVQVTQVLSWFVQKTSDLEMSFVSVDRIKEYSKCPQEAAWKQYDSPLPKEWPTKGEIKFSNYQTRYRPGLDLALNGLSCDIKSLEKIGIVGRTGAGKSSLSLGIFRIIEAAEGIITIDGVDISKIGLHDLRKQITIIPQDPLILSGSLRENLDPSNSCSDELIWKALEGSHLKDYVSSLNDGLMHPMTEGGANFSAGQQQLVCLARAILRKSKILVMDEATASLDAETDELLQKTIRDEFADCTVLIIAHRLQSVLDSNRVMVLDKGQIKEFDSPENLLKDEESVFHSLAADSNLLKRSDRLSDVSEISDTSSSSQSSTVDLNVQPK